MAVVIWNVTGLKYPEYWRRRGKTSLFFSYEAQSLRGQTDIQSYIGKPVITDSGLQGAS